METYENRVKVRHMLNKNPKLEDLKTSHTLGGTEWGRGYLRRGKRIGVERFESVRGECGGRLCERDSTGVITIFVMNNS